MVMPVQHLPTVLPLGLLATGSLDDSLPRLHASPVWKETALLAAGDIPLD